MAERTLTTRAYLEELLYTGSVTDRPHIQDHLRIKPTYLLKRERNHVIAAQISSALVFSTEPQGITVTPEPATPRTYYLDLVYYPTNLDHAEILSRSTVRAWGPQSYAPGAAAVLALSHDTTAKIINVAYLQYCFIQGSPHELSRSLASRYLGASYHLFKTLFELDIVRDAQLLQSESSKLPIAGNPVLERVLGEVPHKFKLEGPLLQRSSEIDNHDCAK